MIGGVRFVSLLLRRCQALIGLGTSGWGEWARGVWGEAWNRRAPVKVPPEQPPPLLFAFVLGLLLAPAAQVILCPVVLYGSLLGTPPTPRKKTINISDAEAPTGLTGAKWAWPQL